MDTVSVWCKSVAAVSVITAVLITLVPDGRLKKVYNTLLTFILLFTILSSVNKSENVLSYFTDVDFFKEKNIHEDAEEYEKSLKLSITENETEKYINKLLFEFGLSCKAKVVCVMKHDEIFISQITVIGKLSENIKKSVKELISENLGFKSEIIFKGD